MQFFECFFLNYTSGPYVNEVPGTDVSGTGINDNTSAWCNLTLLWQVTPGEYTIGLIDNVFLICGNRAWKAIPGRAVGGPCTFG